jgi:hypothetical protein
MAAVLRSPAGTAGPALVPLEPVAAGALAEALSVVREIDPAVCLAGLRSEPLDTAPPSPGS